MMVMRTRAALGLCFFVLATSACKSGDAAAPAAPAGAAPSVTASVSNARPLAAGDRAPDFRLQGSDGKAHALADHAGKQVVVVAWFPKAFTGG